MDRPGANITADPASASESCGQVFTESEEVMATTKGRKTTARKKPAKKAEEAVVESPVEEVIEPEAPVAAAQEELPPEPAEKEVVEEAPVVESAPEPEVAKVEEEPQVEVKAEEPPPPPAPKPEPVVAAAEPAPVAPRQVVVGSLVVMPSGKQGKVVSFDHKGRAHVSKLSNPRKVYAYLPNQLSLVK